MDGCWDWQREVMGITNETGKGIVLKKKTLPFISTADQLCMGFGI